jgi:error-prone DNA polymerase
MMAVHGRIQSEGEVVHLVAHRLTDLSAELASIGDRDIVTPASRGHDSQIEYGRGPRPNEILGHDPRDSDLLNHDLETIKFKMRDFG